MTGLIAGEMSPRSNCSHLTTISDVPITDIVKTKENMCCNDCSCYGPNLWICLHKDCLRIGCSENFNDHSTLHNRTSPSHCVHMNLSTQRIWCYSCRREVFLRNGRNSDSDNETGEGMDSGRGSYATPRFGSAVLSVGLSGDSCDSSDSSESTERISGKPGGLVGLQNIGNTCYMNSALQALSNTPPLTEYFLECSLTAMPRAEGRKPALSRSYQRLMKEMWHRKSGGYVVPSGILYGIRNVHSMFRGYHQHDTQEFLRCFMDQLHEELKAPCNSTTTMSHSVRTTFEFEGGASNSPSQSEGEYETCDSGVSERSSLSDDTERSASEGRRGSPAATSKRLRSKLTVGGRRPQVVDAQPGSPRSPPPQEQLGSIISDVFDGKLLSSVQCLTCDRVSTRVETFQDLSLPIPSRDHLAVLHGTGLAGKAAGGGGSVTCSEAVYPGGQDGWVAWLWAWFKSWFYGPTVSLHDCLAAFFSADELKGDNMYSCEKCNKLRNGVKFSKVVALPEVLCIHLKRFRHELMFSSKISSQVSFPLAGLDMRPYLHKDCSGEVSSYDLISVICHHGTAGGGHYTCYSLNCHADVWFEFDDQYVTQVSPETVAACEAYVLFYRKSEAGMRKCRQKAAELAEGASPDEPRWFISKRWIGRFNTFAEPGPIDNSDFACPHGHVLPERAPVAEQLSCAVPRSVWEYLLERFGGGPACNRLRKCAPCDQIAEARRRRVQLETETFRQLNQRFRLVDEPTVFAVSMRWIRQWQAFVRADAPPPGPIDNSAVALPGQPDAARPGADFAHVSEDLWRFFHGIYGGGPELRVRLAEPDSVALEMDREEEKDEREETDAADVDADNADNDDDDEELDDVIARYKRRLKYKRKRDEPAKGLK